MPLLSISDIKIKTEQLPAMSSAAAVLLSVIGDPDVTRDEVAYLVSVDQTLAANAFKLANSAYYGSRREFESIKDIVDFLGLQVVEQIAVFVAAKSIYPNKNIWFQSVYTANASKQLMKMLGHDNLAIDLAYTAALFENYGCILLQHFYKEEYEKINTHQDFHTRLKKEKEVFGYNHIEISAIALASMGVPNAVLKIIENQNQLDSDAYCVTNTVIDVARTLFDFRDGKVKLIDAALEKDPLKTCIKKHALKLELSDEFLGKLLEESNSLTEMSLI